MSDNCTCDPLRPHGCKADGCLNSANFDYRRERIATVMLPDAAKSVHSQYPKDSSPESTRKAATVALAYADALIAELDRA